MKLFFAPGACSLSPHIALLGTGLKFTAEKVDLKTKIWSGGDFRKINPKGSVPVLQLDNGEVLSEGAVILQYIADQKPESGLLAKPGTWERYRTLEWLNFIASDIHKGYSALFSADRWVSNKEGNAQLKAAAQESLSGRLNFVAESLKDKSYLMGANFSAADIYLFVCLRWSPMVGIDLARWAPIVQFMERVSARPHVREAMAAEGLKI